MDKKKRPATQSSSAAQVDDDWVARLADFLFGEDKKTGPPTQSPSADAGDDEAARLADFLVTDELGVTRPVSEVPSSYAAR
ncbi:MAG: hypothetical protein F4X27_15905, partial [Chloroflexi bacterium]|nr:hypothetical protein [Chloroflexota bacterium]